MFGISFRAWLSRPWFELGLSNNCWLWSMKNRLLCWWSIIVSRSKRWIILSFVFTTHFKWFDLRSKFLDGTIILSWFRWMFSWFLVWWSFGHDLCSHWSSFCLWWFYFVLSRSWVWVYLEYVLVTEINLLHAWSKSHGLCLILSRVR